MLNLRKGREITTKVIQVKTINNRRIAEFFASKYMKNKKDMPKQKS